MPVLTVNSGKKQQWHQASQSQPALALIFPARSKVKIASKCCKDCSTSHADNAASSAQFSGRYIQGNNLLFDDVTGDQDSIADMQIERRSLRIALQ